MPEAGHIDCQTSNDCNSSVPIIMFSEFMFSLFALPSQFSAFSLFSLYMKEKRAGRTAR